MFVKKEKFHYNNHMAEDDESKEHLRPPAGVSGDLAGKRISYYFNLFKWPVLVALLAEIILIIINQPNVYLWFVNLLLFVSLTVWVKYVYNLRLGQTIILSVCAGFILGFLVALFKLIWWHKFYLFFNVVTETMMVTMAGLLLSGGTYLVISKEYRKKEESLFNFIKKNKKGGGENGK